MRYVIIFFLLIFSSCKEENKTSIVEYDNKGVEFYPVDQYIDSQIAEVMKEPYFIYDKRTVAGNEDSMPVEKNSFISFAKQFIEYNIADSSVKKFYKESVFHDAETKSITLNYSTGHPELPVRNIDVLLDEVTNTPKWIFINQYFERNDSVIDKKMGWKPNERCFINTNILVKGKKLSEQHTMVWNDKKR